MMMRATIKVLSRKTICLVLLLLSGGAMAADVAGTVIAVKGQVSASDTQGQDRSLAKEAEVFVSDAIKTGANSYAVIEFIDGAKATIRPNSTLVVREYAFNNAENGALLELVKGGLRCITGGIAKKQPESYTVQAGVATLGVRGTEFALRICEDDCAGEEQRLAEGRLAGHGVAVLSYH